jgi:hypothetical protein
MALPKLVVVTGSKHSGTSMMMRVLELGGVPCCYDVSAHNNPPSYSSIRHPYGYYEGGTIPETGMVAVKRFLPMTMQSDPRFAYRLVDTFDCYFLFMSRPIADVNLGFVASHNDPNADFTDHFTATRASALTWLADKKHIVVDVENLVNNTADELAKIESFLPIPFDIATGATGIDRELYWNKQPPDPMRGN